MSDQLNSVPAPNPLTTPIRPQKADWAFWARRLLVCNPFFLCSAALFLFGISRLSLDPNFLGDETSNLLFNFSALQFYEILVVGTALVLAARRIWYDSALLVVIENGVVLVPFFLISHGVVTTRSLGAAFACVAVGAAGLRFTAIRRFYPSFNLPNRALVLGGLILLLNAILPFTFWPWVRPDMDRWIAPNQMLWQLGLPLIAAGANLLPRPARYGGSNQERPWLPLFIYSLWVTGTAVHVWCVGYLCSIPFEWRFLAPVIWVGAWTFWRRIQDCVPEPAPALRAGLLGLTFVAPLFSAGDSTVFEALLLLNLVLYVMIARRETGLLRSVVVELIFATVCLGVAGAPLQLIPDWLGPITRTQLVLGTACLAGLLYALRWPHPGFGLLMAVALAAAPNLVGIYVPRGWIVHAPAVFLLLQSLFWRVKNPGLTALRIAAAGLWILHTIASVTQTHSSLQPEIIAEGLMMAAVAVVVRMICGAWRSPLVGIAGLIVAVLPPMELLYREGSSGVLALLASALLFAAGATVAGTRHRWQHHAKEN